MRFLDGPGVETVIRELLTQATRIRAAVAFWGNGAAERLGIAGLDGKDVQIVCDLRSGGCNPNEVKRLQEILGSERIKTCDGLHAKVWIADNAVLIGPSNASSNGLGFENEETKGLVEANLFVEDTSMLSTMSNWFEKTVWNNSLKITPQDLKRAHVVWKRRRNRRPFPSHPSILYTLAQDPAFFVDRDFFIWIYAHDDPDLWAEELYDNEKRKRYDSDLDFWQVGEEEVNTPPGSYILDFDFKGTRATYDRLYQVVKDQPLVETPDGKILLCKPVKRAYGLLLTTRGRTTLERSRWEAAAASAATTERVERCGRSPSSPAI
jgi:hypothetical protein